MKKIISFIILVTLVASIFPVYADEADTRFGILKSFGIMQGYGGGDLGLDRYVTRAEFTKMAIAASSYRNSVSSSMSISPFPDTTYDKWYSPYVYLGVANKLIAGYKDGTFKPDNKVLYEEAVAILLRLLGYQDSEFAYSWPTGQIGMAERIGLCDGVNAVAGQALKRNQVSYLFYNLLKAKNKSGADYVSVLEHSIVSDIVIISSYLQTDSVKKGYVNTSLGLYEVSEDFDYSMVGYKGDAVLKNNKIVMFVPESTNRSTYTVFSVSGDNLILFKDGAISDYKLGKEEVLYYDSTKSTVGAMLSQFAAGDILELHCNKKWDLEYVIYNESSLEGPIVIKSSDWYKSAGIGENASVVKNGKISSLSEIKVNDVAYYSTKLQTVWVTEKKISGTYDGAIPNADQISQIKLSGVTYNIETVEAFQKLSSGGKYKIGDRITLILGRDGEVCDVLSESGGETYVVYGVVGDKILVYNDGELTELNIPDSTTAYAFSGTLNGTLKTVKSQLDMGYVIDVVRDFGGTVSYVTVSETEMSGPFTAKKGDAVVSNNESTIILKNGKRISETEIENGDVVYYSDILNMIWVYNDKVTGVYESALPDMNRVSQVKISGVTYTIDSAQAFKKLSAGGNYKIGDRVTLLLDKDGNVCDVLENVALGERYIVYNVLGDNVLVYQNGKISTLNIKNSTTAYMGTSVSTFGNVKNLMDTGYIIEITKDYNENISYITVSETILDGPYTAEAGNMGVNTNSDTVIFKNGEKIAVSEVEENDILYHSESLNMVWVYNETVTGVYENAMPNKNTPSSVTVSGKTYEIEGVNAYKALGANGSAQYGDTVTLLLGKDGKVADVQSGEQLTSASVVFVLSCGSKEYTDNQGNTYSAPYVSLLTPEGNVVEYESKKDYTNYYKNQVSELTFENGKAVLSEISSETVGGNFSHSSNTLGTVKMTGDVKIVDIVKGTSNIQAMYKKIYPQRLDGMYISSNKVMYAGKDGEGKINVLFLNDLTGDAYSYGLVTIAENTSLGMNTSGSYTYFDKSTKMILRTSGKSFTVYSGNPVQIRKNSNSVENLTKLSTLGKVTDITSTMVKIDGKAYKYLSDMTIYYHDGNEYQAITVDKFREVMQGKTATAYAERTDAASARVRVIVVK